MLSPRETIAAAFFNALKTATGVSNASRTLLHWDKVDSAAMPALFVVQVSQVAKPAPMTGLPYVWNFSLKVYVYTSVGGDESATPSTQQNVILDAIEAVCSPPRQGERNTLGGLVSDCRISGNIETDEGTLGTVAVAIVPVEIVA